GGRLVEQRRAPVAHLAGQALGLEGARHLRRGGVHVGHVFQEERDALRDELVERRGIEALQEVSAFHIHAAVRLVKGRRRPACRPAARLLYAYVELNGVAPVHPGARTYCGMRPPRFYWSPAWESALRCCRPPAAARGGWRGRRRAPGAWARRIPIPASRPGPAAGCR